MKLVNLVSGGLDSTLVSLLAKEEGYEVHGLFIDYGQRAAIKEWETCNTIHSQLDLPKPIKMDLSGYGKVIISGLTSDQKDIKEDAFTPGRNMLFLLMGSAYAHQIGAKTISIGLLSEKYSLFPDQSSRFVKQAEITIKQSLGRSIRIVVPLSDFSKKDVVRLAREKGVSGTYSCHEGSSTPCGKCIACKEYDNK